MLGSSDHALSATSIQNFCTIIRIYLHLLPSLLCTLLLVFCTEAFVQYEEDFPQKTASDIVHSTYQLFHRTTFTTLKRVRETFFFFRSPCCFATAVTVLCKVHKAKKKRRKQNFPAHQSMMKFVRLVVRGGNILRTAIFFKKNRCP